MKAVLTFHSIDDSGSVLSYHPRMFSLLISKLIQSNIPILDLPTLLAPTTDHGVVLTFDDGMHSVLSHALPILKEHGVPAHIFVTTAAIGTGHKWPEQPQGIPGFNMLNWSEVEQLHNSGIRIEAHTQSHLW